METPVIEIDKLSTSLQGEPLHKDLSFKVYAGEIMGIVGASGCGKSILLRTILGLNPYDSGSIKVFGRNPRDKRFAADLRKRWGVLFQNGALFSSLTVGENIRVPMREIARMPEPIMQALTFLKLKAVGLSEDAEPKFPSELSGGMVKRAALARALALDAELLFLDEPTSGLDPLSARHFDELIKELQGNLGLTVMMITHDLDSLLTVCDRIAVLVDQKVVVGTVDELQKNPHPWIKEYFGSRTSSKRERKA